VNTGSDVPVTFFCYPADSGQDYEIIARTNGLKVLIVDDQAGGWPAAEITFRTEAAAEVIGQLRERAKSAALATAQARRGCTDE
jgi:glucose-6-phosphate isomerase